MSAFTRNVLTAGVIGGLAACAWLAAAAVAAPVPAGPPSSAPVVVELFTSEGCSSCPPADQFLADLVSAGPTEGINVIPLSEHVDYWNRQGWIDPFSSASFTERQQRYSSALTSDVFTPQMVVDGATQVGGNDRGAAIAAIRQAAAAAKVQVSVTAASEAGKARIHAEFTAAGGTTLPDGDVIVAITEDGLASAVSAGENKGHRLTHIGVTRSLEKIGRLKRGQATTAIDATAAIDGKWSADHLHVVVFVQSKDRGRIVGAASAPLGGNRQASLEAR